MSKCVRYSQKEQEWVTKNFPLFTNDELYEQYKKVFGNKRSARGLDSFGKYLGLKKETTNWFNEQETKWLVDNYATYEPVEITYKRFCDTFGNEHPYIGFVGKVKQLKLHKPKYMTMLQYRYLQTHDEIPPNCYLTEIDGEVIDIPKDIYNCLNARNLLGKGEITKTMVEIYKAKKEIEKITHKKVFQYIPTKEHMAKMNSVPKTYHRRFEGEKLEELKRLKAQGMNDTKLAKRFNVCRHTIQKTLKREGIK